MNRSTKENNSVVNKSVVSDNNSIVNTYNNDNIDRPSINKNSINTGVDKKEVDIERSNINKPSNVKSKTGTNNINAKKAKFEEDVKKEPILQTIIDVFDGELLN